MKKKILLIFISIFIFRCAADENKETVETITIVEDYSANDGVFAATLEVTNSEINYLFTIGYTIPLTLTKANSSKTISYEIFRTLKKTDTTTDTTSVDNCPLATASDSDTNRLTTYQQDSNCIIESSNKLSGTVTLDFDYVGTALFGASLRGSTDNFSDSFIANDTNYNLRFGSSYSHTTSAFETPLKVKLTELQILLYEAIATIYY